MRLVLLSTLVAAAIAVPGLPAAAAVEQADLVVRFDPARVDIPEGTTNDARMIVTNRGTVTAEGVTATLDISAVPAAVTVKVPTVTTQCVLAAQRVTCELGALAPGGSITVFPLTMTAAPGSAPITASVAVSVSGAATIVQLPVVVVPTSPIPVMLIADVGSAGDRVGPGSTRPVYAAVRNGGDVPLVDTRVAIQVPVGAVIAEPYRDCGRSSNLPGAGYTPTYLDCHLTLDPPLMPGETLPLFDPVTKKSLVHAKFGRNLSGPDQLPSFASTFPEADPGRPDSGDGPSFREAAARMPVIAPGETPAWWPELHGDGGVTPYAIFTKPNTFDIAVTKPVVAPYVGEPLASLDFSLADLGPADSGDLEYVVTAPKGTVLLPFGNGDECYTQGQPGTVQPESAALVCRTPGEYFPAQASGFGPSAKAFVLRIKSKPGGGGKVVVKGGAIGPGAGPRESKPGNNSAAIVFPAIGGGGSGGGGGGLPITGTPVALVAGVGGGVVILGVALLFFTRRRRKD